MHFGPYHLTNARVPKHPSTVDLGAPVVGRVHDNTMRGNLQRKRLGLCRVVSGGRVQDKGLVEI
eukprot:3942751-Lingulodinium_polyedra.AAC.1